jgi:plasmid stability protein
MAQSYWVNLSQPVQSGCRICVGKELRWEELQSRLYMCVALKYACNMSKMIQVRNVPDALHRGLKARAAMAGMSLSDYLLAEIKEIAERPTLAELRDRLHKRKPISAQLDTARLVREEREAR